MSDIAPITKERGEAALAALLGYQQADEDGVMVFASRQAIHEVAARLSAAEAEIERLKGALEAIDKKADEPMADVADFGTAAWNEEAASHRGQLKWEMQQIARAAISKESK